MDLDSPRLRVRPAESGLVLEGRWKILPDPFVFEDENYTIFSGLDVKQSTRVAIKVYQGSDVVTWRKFRRSIDFQLTLRSRFSDDGGRLEPSVPLEKLLEELKARMSLTDFPAARLFLTKMNLRECFADLISFSHDSNWNPALDPETGLFFAILECPPEAISLQQRLDVCRMAKEPMSIEEVLQIQWALISMVLGLNAEGLVHLEMDPSRIIAFQKNGKTLWKLMDFDPILCAGTHIRPQELPSYEWYAPPEIAKVFLRGPRDGERVAITTGLMVFSAGMCMLDVSTHLACHDDAGLCWRLKWDQKHPGKSPIALAGENSVRATTSLPVIPQECLEMLRRTNMDLGRLLEAMLSRNPEKRIHIGQCVMHPWFEPKRSAIFYAKWSMPDEPPVPGTTGPGSPPPTLHFPTEQHGPTTTTATAAMTTMSQKKQPGAQQPRRGDGDCQRGCRCHINNSQSDETTESDI